MSRDDAGLLVGDPAVAQGGAQGRELVEAALERHALRDGPLRHAEPLGAVVAEAEELQVAPEAELSQEHGQVAEEVVPAGPEVAEPAQVGVEPGEIDGSRPLAAARSQPPPASPCLPACRGRTPSGAGSKLRMKSQPRDSFSSQAFSSSSGSPERA